MIRLSIIVPFYNVEKYIEQCIRSLYDQDIPLEEYEVICVDDCSPDGSRAIVERLQKEYSTLQLICHTENKRQGGARNTGLKVAKGEYIWFVDSDDYVLPNVMGKLLKDAEQKKAEIVAFDYTSKESLSVEDKQIDKASAVMTGEKYIFANAVDILWYDRLVGPWRQLIRKDFLLDNDIHYVENVQYEDTDYLLKAYLYANSVVYLPIVAYYYRPNMESTTATLTPLKLLWMLNQMERCAALVPLAKDDQSRGTIRKMVADSVCKLRMSVKSFNKEEKNSYRKLAGKNWSHIHSLVNWRTWLAVRYGITKFVPQRKI